MYAQQLDVVRIIGSSSGKRSDMINLIGEKNAVTVGIQPAINADVILGRANPLDVISDEVSFRALFPSAASFDSSAPLIRVSATPILRLAIGRFTIVLPKLASVSSMTQLAKARLAITFRRSVIEIVKRFDLLALPAMLQACISKPLSSLPVLLCIRIARFLTTSFAGMDVTSWVGALLMKLRERLDLVADTAALHFISGKPYPLGFGASFCTFFTRWIMAGRRRCPFPKLGEWLDDTASRTALRHISPPLVNPLCVKGRRDADDARFSERLPSPTHIIQGVGRFVKEGV